MTITAWRIVKAARAREAFLGDGARRFGGRWNHRGTSVAYAAGSLSLAVLEILVHLEGNRLLASYVQVPVEFDHGLCLQLDPGDLPDGWAENPAPDGTKDIGTEWVASGASVALAVPSAIVPDEQVYLLNPGHVEFSAVQIGRPESFRFDPRLLRGS